MEIGKTFYPKNRVQWHAWLKKNHRTKKEIWVVYYKKHSNKPRVSYNDAVDEALCFGWIDSIVKTLDYDRYVQRFTPRKPTSVLSQLNKERVRELIKQNRMTKAGLTALAHVFDPTTDVPGKECVIPRAIQTVLQKDKETWHNFQAFPEAYKRIRISYIEHGKQQGKQECRKRLNNFLQKTKQNKRFGFVK